MPVFNTWLISKVSGLIIAGSIILIHLEDIPSSPQLFFLRVGFVSSSYPFLRQCFQN